MKRIIFLLILVVACSKFASEKQKFSSNVKLPLYKETVSGSEVVSSLVKGNEFEIKEKKSLRLLTFLVRRKKNLNGLL